MLSQLRFLSISHCRAFACPVLSLKDFLGSFCCNICVCDAFTYFSRSLNVSALCEVHSSMGKTVKLFCSGEWDPKRVPEGTEHLEPLLEETPTNQPRQPDRSFTGKIIET